MQQAEKATLSQYLFSRNNSSVTEARNCFQLYVKWLPCYNGHEWDIVEGIDSQDIVYFITSDEEYTMKSDRRRKGFAWLGLVIMLLAILTTTVGCLYPLPFSDPLFDMVLENQTDQTLTIYAGGIAPVGNVSPGQQIILKDRDSNRSEFPIIAKNAEGEVVFSYIYTYKDLQKIDERTYKAVIPPLEIQ